MCAPQKMKSDLILLEKHSHAALDKASICAVSLVGATGGFLFGFNMHMITSAVLFIKEQFDLNPQELGFAVSCAMTGCMVGAVAAALLADQIGRKRTLAVTALVLIAGTIGTVLAKSIAQFDAFRILSGLGVGVVSVVSPMYMAEISPVRLRGRLVTINQLTIVTAGFLSVIVGYYFTPTANWRAMFATCFVPVLFLLMLLPFVPESPRWLIRRNRHAEARKALGRIYREDDAISYEVREISVSLLSSQDRAQVRDLVRPGVRKAFVIGLVLAMCAQLTGISALSWYLPLLFQRAGFMSAGNAMLETIIANGWQLICSITAMFFIDRVGRRPLLLFGTCGMAISLIFIGMLFYYPGASGLLVLLAIMLAMGLYNFALAPLFWLLISEIFPTTLRAKGMAMSSLMKWSSAFVSALSFPMLIAYSDTTFKTIAPVFWMFAAISIGAFVFCYRAVPETRNRSLEEIAALWERVSGE